MADRHGTVEVALELDASPSAVWAAYTDPALRGRWFRMPGPSAERTHAFDIREGGVEVTHGAVTMFEKREELDLTITYLHLRQPERIVSAHELRIDGMRHLAALVDIAFEPLDDGRTRLVHRDDYVLLGPEEGLEAAHRERRGGTRLQLNGLVGVLRG